MFWKKFQPGWFKLARKKWYRENVRSWAAYQRGMGSLKGSLEYEPGHFSYTSGFMFNGYEDYFQVGHEKAFWLARRQAKREDDHFTYRTNKDFEKATTL